MTAEECERLFTPYYTTKQHGTGLGLAIVQSVISDHNGTIRVESTPGSGSTFVVELPSLAGASQSMTESRHHDRRRRSQHSRLAVARVSAGRT